MIEWKGFKPFIDVWNELSNARRTLVIIALLVFIPTGSYTLVHIMGMMGQSHTTTVEFTVTTEG